MIEFTLSRTVLAVCGLALLLVAVGTVSDSGERIESDMDSQAAVRLAGILDGFESSVLTEITLNGWELLPSADHTLEVRDHVVTLTDGEAPHSAYTGYGGAFVLSWGSSIRLEKSLAEGLGNLADGVGEDVDVLEVVVQVCRGPRAAVYPAGDVERMGAVHPGTDHHAALVDVQEPFSRLLPGTVPESRPGRL